LAKGDYGILDRPEAPLLKNFSQRFLDAIQVRCAAKPATVLFYSKKLARLLMFESLANSPLDEIDEVLIEKFVQHRSKQVSPASVNRELATLRRLLRLAQEWKVIDRVPRIRLLRGERTRDFVLSHQQEHLYLEAAPQPLRDVALLMLDTGLRLGEVVALQWRDVHLEPVNGARYGYLQIRDGKSANARRNVCLADRAKAMLEERIAIRKSHWVFPGDPGKPFQATSLDHQHAKLRALLKFPSDFVLHSLRHTLLTRLGHAGVDAFTMMRIAGHSSVTISQRYVHPTPETLERAFERLEALNCSAGKPETALTVPTNLPTLEQRRTASC
jgi:integrase